jgi:hypothetical protein
LCEKLARRLAAIEGENGCGRGPAALLFAAEAPLREALEAAGSRRARLAAEARFLIARAKHENQSCTIAFSGFAPKLQEIEKLLARLPKTGDKNGDRHQ